MFVRRKDWNEMESNVCSLRHQKDRLKSRVLNLEEQVEEHKQTMDLILDKMGYEVEDVPEHKRIVSKQG